MELQAKKKSFWSTFKNAYLRQKNLKKFWMKLDKTNLPEELIKTFNLVCNKLCSSKKELQEKLKSLQKQ